MRSLRNRAPSAARLIMAVVLALAAWPVAPGQAAQVVVTDVTLEEAAGGLQVAVAASGPVSPQLVALNPAWIVMDVRDAQLAASYVTRPLRRGIIRRVRMSQHVPEVVRVIVELSRPAPYYLRTSPDEHGVVIGIPGSADGRPVVAQAQAPVTPVPASPGLIDLKARNMEIVDVLTALAKLAHVNLVTDAAVRGTITVQLTGVTFEQALALVLEPNGLGYTMAGNNLIVGVRPILRRYQLTSIAAKDLVANILPVTGIRKEQVSVDDATNAIFVYAPPGDQARLRDLLPQVDVPSQATSTRVVKLSYIDATTFLDLLTPRLPDAVAKAVKVDKGSNSVVVTATAAQMKIVDDLLGQVDNALPQVLIEASVAEVPTEVTTNLGVAWQTATTFVVTSTGTTPTGQLQISVTAPGTSTCSGICAILSTLISENKARLLANPRIAVRDGETARMNIGDKIPFQVINAQGNDRNTWFHGGTLPFLFLLCGDHSPRRICFSRSTWSASRPTDVSRR